MVQLSAFNTPQFDWARSHMPRRAQPVPPIFQPEIAARGIVWASKHRRREVCVGWPAVKAIWGNKLMPRRSEEHTSELQSLMRISYAVFCLKKKKKTTHRHT